MNRLFADPGARNNTLAWLILMTLSGLVMFANAAIDELHATAVFYAALAREIVEHGDPLYIFTGAEAYLLKPPLLIWCCALAMKVFGYTHFAATVAPRAFGFICVALTYSLVRRVANPRVAVIAAFIVLTNSTFVQFGTSLRMEPAMLAGILLAVRGYLDRDRPLGSIAMFGGLSIALLSKGPISLMAVPIMLLHWWLVPDSRRRGLWWPGVVMLSPILAWYGFLIFEHGLAPVFSLTEDFARPSSNPDLNFWQSAWLEYGVRPAMRYWPWLPFMLLGLLLPLWRSFVKPTTGRREASPQTENWLIAWTVLIVLGSVTKPDHDIRYLYPAIPALAALAAVVIERALTRLPGAIVAGIAALLVFAICWYVSTTDFGRDRRDALAQMRLHVAAHAQDYLHPVIIEGYLIPPNSSRWQNTHRDWVYYYLGVEPILAPPPRTPAHNAAIAAAPYVLASRSAGHAARLAELGFRPLIATNEFVLAVPLSTASDEFQTD